MKCTRLMQSCCFFPVKVVPHQFLPLWQRCPHNITKLPMGKGEWQSEHKNKRAGGRQKKWLQIDSTRGKSTRWCMISLTWIQHSCLLGSYCFHFHLEQMAPHAHKTWKSILARCKMKRLLRAVEGALLVCLEPQSDFFITVSKTDGWRKIVVALQKKTIPCLSSAGVM